MAKTIDEEALKEIEDVVRPHGPQGLTAAQIGTALASTPPPRTLQYRIKYLVDHKRLFREGARRGARYAVPRIAEVVGVAVGTSRAEAIGEAIVLPLSRQGATIQRYVRQPFAARKP